MLGGEITDQFISFTFEHPVDPENRPKLLLSKSRHLCLVAELPGKHQLLPGPNNLKPKDKFAPNGGGAPRCHCSSGGQWGSVEL